MELDLQLLLLFQLSVMTGVIEESGTLDRLEQLQHHENEDIYKASYEIIEEYFAEDDDGLGDVASATAEPEVNPDGTLGFNPHVGQPAQLEQGALDQQNNNPGPGFSF